MVAHKNKSPRPLRFSRAAKMLEFLTPAKINNVTFGNKIK